MRSRLAAVLVATTLALVGCGSDSDGDAGKDGKTAGKDTVSSLSATEILAKSMKAVTAADSVRAKGTGKDSGQNFTLDMTYVGDEAKGSFGIDGDELQLIRADGVTYFKADDSFWRAQLGDKADTVLTVINGRWIKTNGEQDFAQLVAFADRPAFVGDLLKPDHTPTKGGTKTIDGVKCIQLKDAEGSLWVAVDDARPIRLENGSSADDGVLRFTYDDADAPDAPSASDVIDSATFQ